MRVMIGWYHWGSWGRMCFGGRHAAPITFPLTRWRTIRWQSSLRSNIESKYCHQVTNIVTLWEYLPSTSIFTRLPTTRWHLVVEIRYWHGLTNIGDNICQDNYSHQVTLVANRKYWKQILSPGDPPWAGDIICWEQILSQGDQKPRGDNICWEQIWSSSHITPVDMYQKQILALGDSLKFKDLEQIGCLKVVMEIEWQTNIQDHAKWFWTIKDICQVLKAIEVVLLFWVFQQIETYNNNRKLLLS